MCDVNLKISIWPIFFLQLFEIIFFHKMYVYTFFVFTQRGETEKLLFNAIKTD